jgi:hypothetical protein
MIMVLAPDKRAKLAEHADAEHTDAEHPELAPTDTATEIETQPSPNGAPAPEAVAAGDTQES